MSNVTVEQWRAWAKADTKPDTATLQQAIDAAEESVNEFVGREFVIAHPSTSSARLFTPGGGSILRIDDAVAVTSITVDGAVYALTSYQLEPVNGRVGSGLHVPYDQVRLLNGAWPTDFGKANVSVTARWGWTTLPNRYANAVMLTTKDLVDLADTRGGVLNFGEYGPMVMRENKYVVALLSKLRRVESFGIA